MGVQFNTKGFVVIEAGGQMTWDSMVSARSGKRTTPGGVLEAVPDTGERLFARLLPREARQMSDAEYEAVFAAARAWYAARVVIPQPAAELRTVLADVLPRRFAERLCETWFPSKPMRQFTHRQLPDLARQLAHWPIVASGTEGYRTAEVTLGGVDTDGVSSATMESKHQPGLYFVGEVLDVTGWLGGYNFQWAWASGHAAGLAA